ncbi:response regulator [Afifella sp. JA880]|uniref:response regulator n=1 Tax=Afifella sp. JA880 TaxID=2975280 RepID=UPI0021BAFA0C|nr:response regulator [Afifella sp. JA880]MCT8267951.1 response regulator [Afifella sp. JA880]
MPATCAGEKAAPLRDCQILLVEDEALVAMDLAYELEKAGAAVTFASTLAEALAIANSNDPPHSAAVLDINLRGEEVYPAAERLAQTGVPFLFCTGHGKLEDVAPRFPDAPVLNKPIIGRQLVCALAALLP